MQGNFGVLLTLLLKLKDILQKNWFTWKISEDQEKDELNFSFRQKKCEQYWSEEGAGKYGDISVEMLDTAVFNDFTIRTFKVAAVSITQLRKLFKVSIPTLFT